MSAAKVQTQAAGAWFSFVRLIRSQPGGATYQPSEKDMRFFYGGYYAARLDDEQSRDEAIRAAGEL